MIYARWQNSMLIYILFFMFGICIHTGELNYLNGAGDRCKPDWLNKAMYYGL